jgi:two-component system chemotaxis sensor kinase CheA
MDDLLPEFLTETNEALADLDLALVKLERVPGDKATLSLIFRLVHTIKGTCGFLGLPRLERVAHAAENVLGRVRDGELAATPDVISLVLAALDQIKAIVAALGATGNEPAGDDAPIITALGKVALGETALSLPEPVVQDGAAETGPISEAPAAEAAANQTIRVTVDVLEGLMTLVGELVLTRNQLLQLSRVQGNTAFSAPLQRLSHITSELQEGVMKTRMQPIGSAWNKLPRLVRDLAQETGKKIIIEMRGQDTELDRQVLELMRDPLTHMVRNSADHGLETPTDRVLAGKPEAGRILLNAFHEGGYIIVEIGDDGRGLDVVRIRAKALSKGLATESELESMTDQQIRAFIFRAGFSTAETVTSISGRGVGMDVVRSNIERIGGTIELASTFGQGSCFTIKIPLTLAIVSALIVQVAGERFAIPQISVMELVRVGRLQAKQAEPSEMPAGLAIEHIGPTPVLRLRDRLLPLVSLRTLLRMDDDQAAPAAEAATVVVTTVGSSLLGIVVDEVFDTEEIVVKPVAPILRHITMFSGNTILGDGSVIMILDPTGVARSAGVSTRNTSTDTTETKTRAAHSDEPVALLLFKAVSNPSILAVPLSLISRLETLSASRIEPSGGGFTTQYRGQLMPLIAMGAADLPDLENQNLEQPVLVFAEGTRSMGLMVSSITDVVHDRLRIELGASRPGFLGTAVIAGQAADVLDISHWLTMARRDWFGDAAGSKQRRRVLVVEDSDFFRQMLVPVLSASGYEVVAAGGAAEALRLRDGGLQIDAIISDIEMPDLDGLAFARLVRQGGAWSALPMIALTSLDNAVDAERGRAAGFTDYVQKSQREALMSSLRLCLADPALV